MLQKLRDRTSGWIATIIIGLLMVPFLFVIDSRYLGGVSANDVARISAPPSWWKSAPSWWPASMLWRHNEITITEFRRAFEVVRQQQRTVQGDSFDAREFESLDNKRTVLEQLIDQRVMQLAAEGAGVNISDLRVDSYIQEIPGFRANGQFNAEAYQNYLRSQRMTPNQFREIVRSELLQSMIPAALSNSAFATRKETDNLMAMLSQTRNVQMATLPPPSADTAPVTDEDIQQWYDSHSADYMEAETVTIEFVDVDAKTLPASAEPSEEALHQRYEQEKSRFSEPEQRLASHILIRVAADADEATRQAAEDKAAALAADAAKPGADFAELAKVNSEDPGSRLSGGDLGWVERGIMVEPFEDALFSMHDSEIKGPVKTDFGYHVLQLREIKPAKTTPFESVRGELAEEQRNVDREREYSDLLGRLTDLTLENPSTLAPAAEKLGLQIQQQGPFSRFTGAGIATDPAVLRSAFSETLIQDGTVSDPIEIGGKDSNHSVIIRVTQHSAEHVNPLDKVRDAIVAAIHADRQDKAVAAAADALLARVRNGEKLSEIAGKDELHFETIDALQRGLMSPTPLANQAIFAAPVPEEGKITADKVKTPTGGYMVFVVDKVTPGDLENVTDAERAQLGQQMSQMESSSATTEYTREARQHVKITIQEAALN
ncbi:MAG: SurA N-terminal domain-containing protein [Xanthomonadaceae bacterium]|jgi:peptidyl-prolyl cis-trans isomerase D|nr:SurA N-terminal domain-containing protein [Xanthomonadaceae bacterium]